MPGTSHVDGTELGLSASEVLRDIPAYPQGTCRFQPNDGQERYVMDAALARLDRWVRSGVPAPEGARIEISNGAYVRDKYLNALGGVRTPALDAPAATLWGGLNSGTTPLCFLLGVTTPLPAAQLAALYPLHSDYVAAVARAAAAAVSQGFLLPADALDIDRAATDTQIGLPAPTG